MDRPLKELIKIASTTLNCIEPIYEFGSRHMEGQEDFADLRGFFQEQTYIGSDYISGKGVDIVLDLHKLELPKDSVGTVICMEVFEHVREPWIAIQEISRVIKDNGILILSAPMNSRIHGSPYDYWRFTPQGFEVLLESAGFKHYLIGSNGFKYFPNNIVAVASKLPINFDRFLPLFDSWQMKWGGRRENYFKVVKRIFLPFIPTIFTGSAFELWRRRLLINKGNHIKELLIILLPPFIRSILRKFKIDLKI